MVTSGVKGAANVAVHPWVFATVDASGGIVMDLLQDRYYGLSPLSAAVWSYCFHGDGSARTPPGGQRIVDEQICVWTTTGLVGRRGLIPPAAAPCRRPQGHPAREMLHPAEAGPVGLRDWMLLQRARVWRKRSLRKAGLCGMLANGQRVSATRSSRDDVLGECTGLLGAYWGARRLISQGRPDCLDRSVDLWWAMRRRGVDASLCIGVQRLPFLAHAWVEVAGWSVNEDTDMLRKLSVLARI